MITYRTDTLLFVPPHIFEALATRYLQKSPESVRLYYHSLGKNYTFIPFKSKKVLPMRPTILAYQLQELHKLGFNLSQH